MFQSQIFLNFSYTQAFYYQSKEQIISCEKKNKYYCYQKGTTGLAIYITSW